VGDFSAGLGYVFAGFRLIARPGLRLYVLVPLLLNTLIFAGLIVYGAGRLDDLIHWLAAQWAWLAWVAWLLWPLFFLIALAVVFFCFSLFVNLIAAPFNGLLSAAVEAQLSGISPEAGGGLAGLPAEIVDSLASEAKKFLYFLVRALPLLLLFLIPFLQAMAPVLWFLFAAWMMAVEYLDYPMGNRGMLFPAMRRVLAGRPMLSLGFGAGVFVLTVIPVCNFIAMPVAVAGATALDLARFRAVNTD
jgi:CysZ protein